MKTNLLLVAVAGVISTGVGGCLDLSDEGMKLSPRVPYESSIRDVGEPVAWNGEALDVQVERGFVEVVGDPDASELVVTARAMTWARYRDVDSAKQINDAILKTASVVKDASVVRVRCGVVEADVGSAQSEATQCNVRVVVPAPAGATHELKLRTGLGDAFLQRLTTSPAGRLDLDVSGLIDGWDPHRNLLARAGASDVEIAPGPGGTVDVASLIALGVGLSTEKGLNDAKDKAGTTLRLPADFATQSLVLWSEDGDVGTPDFPDLTPTAAVRPGASPAALVRATADWGHVSLFAAQEFSSRTRTSTLGDIVSKP